MENLHGEEKRGMSRGVEKQRSGEPFHPPSLPDLFTSRQRRFPRAALRFDGLGGGLRSVTVLADLLAVALSALASALLSNQQPAPHHHHHPSSP